MSGPAFSVMVPAWNARDHLPTALACLRHQTWRDWEAVVVDDGSTDDTWDVAREIVGDDPRFHLVRHETNRGLAAARNTALARSRGRSIAFLDADDLWAPTMLERQASAQRDGSTTVSFCNFFYLESGGLPKPRWRDAAHMEASASLQALMERNRFAQSSVALPRRLLERAGGYDEGLAGSMDWDLWLRLGEAGATFLPVAELLAFYRLWPGNMTARRAARARAQVEVLDRALAREQPGTRRRAYRRARARARGDLEISRAREASSGRWSLVAAVWWAWRLSPRRLRLLLMGAGLAAGGPSGRAALRRIRRKW